MKKAIVLCLAFLSVLLLLCGCSGTKQKEDKFAKYQELIDYLEAEDYDRAISYIQNRIAQTGMGSQRENLSKDELLVQAVKVNAKTIGEDYIANQARAKETYCNKVLLVDGIVGNITGEHVEIYGWYGANVIIDASLPTEEQMTLDRGQRVLVVGKTNDVIEKRQHADYTSTHMIMPIAYVVQDRFEVSGKVFKSRTDNRYYICVPPTSSKCTPIEFAQQVDTSIFDRESQILSISAKMFPTLADDGYYSYSDAVPVNGG